MQPHKCPVCNGTGKIEIIQKTSTSCLPQYESCRACSGKGIVWEPERQDSIAPWKYPITPEYPIIPSPVLPNELPGLTWPSNYKFPEHIEKNTTQSLIKYLESWIKDLKKTLKDNGKKKNT